MNLVSNIISMEAYLKDKVVEAKEKENFCTDLSVSIPVNDNYITFLEDSHQYSIFQN